jgi:uracil-DNA glycosylase family 4
MAEELHAAGYKNLAAFVGMRPDGGSSVLVIAARFFFRREVEENSRLFQGLAFAQLERLGENQELAFNGLRRFLSEQGERVEQLLGSLQDTVSATHENVQEIHSAVLAMQQKLDLMHGELRPRDSLSIRGDAERSLVKELIGRYRSLPAAERERVPSLLNAVGKLEVAAGDFKAAQQDFLALADIAPDPGLKAEAHHNAYRAALERHDWDAALREVTEAARLDAARFAPFPVTKYVPKRILGAGGFGVAYLCRHRYMNSDVVVKTLTFDDLDRDVNTVFAEAQTLRQADHPSIIRVQDCGFGSPNEDARPYLVMDYFDGATLEEAAREKPLPPESVISIARQVAEGLAAAHDKGILHRDVKPANLLVREDGGWQVKLIDFGLALKREGRDTLRAGSHTLVGNSIAGTLDYAAPEQMGRIAGASVRPCSDVYGFGRTMCYALFQTPQPLLRHWRSIPAPLAELLENCLEDQPASRPQDFKDVLARLNALSTGAAPPPVTLPVVTQAAAAPKAIADMARQERERELAALVAKVAGCTRCAPLARGRTQTVFGEGPLDPEVLFIGEAPGADEDIQGRPFVGAAGQIFNTLLESMGLKREEVYITNILKCRPPNNRTPAVSEATNCREFLDRQIALVRPKYLVTLGGCASQNLLNTTQTIGRLRGRLYDYQGIPVLCTYHPAFLLPSRSPERIGDVKEDLKLLLRRMGRPVA